jgi:hypothetical protein
MAYQTPYPWYIEPPIHAISNPLPMEYRENTEGAIKNGQSRETGNIGYTRRRKNKTKTQHNMCWTPLYANKQK